MSYFNTMEAVEKGDSYVFIKRDMGEMVWYVTCFWNEEDSDVLAPGVIIIKAYPRPRRRHYKVIHGKRMRVFLHPKHHRAWTDQVTFESLEAFWDYIDGMSLNSKVTIESKIYLEARKVLKPGQ